MAFLWEHPKSKYWIARFYDKDGKRRNRSTKIEAKAATHKAAQKLADEYEEAAIKPRTARQARKVIANLQKEITGEDLVTVTLREYVNTWTKRKEHEVAKSTLDFYKGATNKFLKFLDGDADKEIPEITRDQITDFRNHEAERLAPRTVNHSLKCIRMLFKDARRDNLIGEDPTEFVQIIRQPASGGTQTFALHQIKALLAVADDEWRSMILFGLYTGQRLGDIAALIWSNVDLEKKEVRLTTSKTNRHMAIPMAPTLFDHVTEMESSDDLSTPLHPRAAAIMENGGSGHLSNQFANLLVQAGLREKKDHKSTGKGRSSRRRKVGPSFHSLRATATTLLHEAGIPPAVAQELIGHDSESIHRVYVRVGAPAMREAVEAYPDLLAPAEL